jgi:hypothetical protein
MRHFITALLLLGFLAGVSHSADEPSAQANSELATTIANLDAPEFATRQAAQEQLKDLNVEQVEQMGEQVQTNPSAEAAIRCVRALEHHFLKDDLSVATAAWKALSVLQVCKRAVVREEVAWVMSHRWKKRTQLAADQLLKHGALIVSPEARAAALAYHRRQQIGTQDQLQRGMLIRVPVAVPEMQVFLTDEWKGDQAALNILKQLPGLQTQNAQAFGANAGAARAPFRRRNRNGQPVVSVFLVAGHSLSETEEAWVQGSFGTAVQERGGVMLGIKALGAVAGSGCGIREVVPFGSGDASGLIGGDLITAVADETIVSFEDLVDELRRFNTGDTIDVTIKRFGPVATGRDNRELTLSVTLRSWKDYVNSTNQAAAEYEAATRKLESETGVESLDE